MARIAAVDSFDIRFPTSRLGDGSDAMNPDPDYSAAYVIVRTDIGGLAGHGFAFTIGRGNEIQRTAIESLASPLVGRDVDTVVDDLGAISREIIHDSQIRWLGPEKGVVHMAAGAILNALWDLRARREAKPLWQLLAGLSPHELVDLVDFRYLDDALSESDALTILSDPAASRDARVERLLANGYPAYATSPGWLGYTDDKMADLAAEAVAAGFGLIKLKVGADVQADIRRLARARSVIGPDVGLAIDANQTWNVDEAIGWIDRLRPADLAWIEEPTSPDDILGHARIRAAVAPVPVASGEHIHNRVMFKQFLQAEALDVVQIDAARVGGVNENLAILLLATAFGKPVCPHAGGVGLCELVQHLAMFDYVAISGTMEGRSIEYVDHLHEHFTDPVRILNGCYVAPTAPGMSAELRSDTVERYGFPYGAVWARETT